MTNLKLSEIENIDRIHIANEITGLFNGKVPSNESEFTETINEEVADGILKSVTAGYESLGFGIKYELHDLFVLYMETMR